MAKCLLINPSYKASYGNAKASIVDPIFPTVGLLSLAAAAKEAGHTIDILDLSYDQYDWQEVQLKILALKPDFVGITGTTPLMNQIRDISTLIHEKFPHIKMIAGGSHVSALPRESIEESYIHIVIMGEGEHTFVEILDGKPLDDILGICYRKQSGTIKQNEHRPFVTDLDNLPYPAWDLFDSQKYKDKMSRLLTRRVPSCMIEFSRGCIYKCDFCASKMTMALGYRKKSPERCAKEVELLFQHGWREFSLADDIFSSDVNWAKDVCRAIIKTGVDVPWTCTNGIRVESADEELFQLMHEAGCYRVSFGFETGNAAVLEAFGKGGKASLEQGIKAAKMARKAGIDVSGFFMLGLSPDTEETMMDTINYASRLPLDMLKFGIAIAFPGTQMFNNYKRNDLIKTYNWDDYFIYTSQPLFAHPNLSFETVQKHMDLGYKKAILQNPKFILRRFWHSLRTNELLWDAYYFCKFFFAPSVNENSLQANYYKKDRWPTYDFDKKLHNFEEYRAAKSKTAAVKVT